MLKGLFNFMKGLLIAFHPNELADGSRFFNTLNSEFDVLTVGFALEQCPSSGSVFHVESNYTDAESIANSLSSRVKNYNFIAASSSMAAKDVIPRLAGSIDAPMVTDVIEVVSEVQFRRPIFAGVAIELVEVHAQTIFFTFRAPSFKEYQPQPEVSCNSELLIPMQPSRTTVVSHAETRSGRPELSQSKVVVSGGKPLKDKETFEKLIGGLADKLGGATGATRAAVDSGIAPNELQVGQTGKIVAPELYIAVGISGSTQHVAGIKDSNIIVAINKDADAPIFEVADIGLVADLFDAVPQLIEILP